MHAAMSEDNMYLRFFSMSRVAPSRSVMMPKALRSVMFKLAAVSRRRTPGSWATSRRTRA